MKTKIRKNNWCGDKKGSVLIITLVIFGIIVVTSLSVALTTLRSMKTSMESSKTNVAYQNADEGIDKTMTAILKGTKTVDSSSGKVLVNSVAGPTLFDGNSGRPMCCPVETTEDGRIVYDASIDCSKTDNSYSVKLLDGATPIPNQINCYNSDKDISEIIQLESTGSDKSLGTQRIVGANVQQKSNNVKLLLHMDSESGTYEFVDSSRVHHSINNTGSVDVSVGAGNTAPITPNYASVAFDGSSGQYLEINDVTSDWVNLGVGDTPAFTVDFWVKTDGSRGDSTQTMFQMKNGNSNVLTINFVKGSPNKLSLLVIGDPAYEYSEDIGDSNWHHLAVVREDNEDVKLYIDGKKKGDTHNVSGDAKIDDIKVGAEDSSTNKFDGNIDELRLSSDDFFTVDFENDCPVDKDNDEDCRPY